MSRSSKDLFPSKFLKAADLGTNRPIATIQRVEIEPIGQGQDQADKAVLYFAEPKIKPLVLNRINTETIEEIAATDDLDLWPGVRIQLFASKTEFQGKRVDCIRVCEPPARPVAKPAPKVKGKPVQDADSEAAAADADVF